MYSLRFSSAEFTALHAVCFRRRNTCDELLLLIREWLHRVDNCWFRVVTLFAYFNLHERRCKVCNIGTVSGKKNCAIVWSDKLWASMLFA